MLMPFGKYSGEPIDDLPSGYIEWALETWDFKTDERKALMREMQAQLAGRRGEGIVRRSEEPHRSVK